MEQQLFAVLKIDMENISARLAKVIEAAKQLESAVNEMQSALQGGVEVTLRETHPYKKAPIKGASTDGIKIPS